MNVKDTGDSRNNTRPAKVVIVANSKQKVFSWTQLVVKYTSKNFGYDYTLHWLKMCGNHLTAYSISENMKWFVSPVSSARQ